MLWGDLNGIDLKGIIEEIQIDLYLLNRLQIHVVFILVNIEEKSTVTLNSNLIILKPQIGNGYCSFYSILLVLEIIFCE